MSDWRRYLRLAQDWLKRVPALVWVVAGLIAVSLTVVLSLEMSGPAYAALYEGLSPADGGKVIAALQKLGIPYQLQAEGNIISVPAPELAATRLKLAADNIPQGGADANWEKLEDAPMTASELAQNTMATQALQASLIQSIETISGVSSAQVFLALPPDTPFLADQPKPSASVVIAADAISAQSQGAAIARLVAGAVPGMTSQQVTVETTAGVTVFPTADKSGTQAQMETVAQVENSAAAHVALLLAPLVGQGNFRTDVSADLDFTHEQIHQINYGPSQLVSHETSALVEHTGNDSGAGFGIPGALSNEPPPATTATTPTPGADTNAQAAAQQPHETRKNTDQTYVTDQSESEITKPDWVVQSIAVSVVLNKAALGAVTIDQVKAAIAGGFAYPNVSVSVLAAPFQAPASSSLLAPTLENYASVTRAALQMMAAAALLFGLAMPLGRRMASLNFGPELTAIPPPRPVAPARPAHDFSMLREKATEKITSVAQLLQNWVEEDG